MYIYNVTINIDEAVHDQWLVWMRDIHIPAMLATGKFTQARMCKVLVDEELGGITYSIQYTVVNKAILDRYYKEDAETMRQDSLRRFGSAFVAFRTELEIITERQANNIHPTELIFAYGTLCEPSVQLNLFGRQLQGNTDQLPGYRKEENMVAGLYPSIVPVLEEVHNVSGRVYAISGSELLNADVYEGSAYCRKKVRLSSGRTAWVYLAKNGETL